MAEQLHKQGAPAEVRRDGQTVARDADDGAGLALKLLTDPKDAPGVATARQIPLKVLASEVAAHVVKDHDAPAADHDGQEQLVPLLVLRRAARYRDHAVG